MARSPRGLGQTITSAVADTLRARVRDGSLAPGARLLQNEIARELNVSTTPVREAFMLLEREGLLVRSDHRGVVVFKPTVADLREIYMIRIPLEALATEEAVPRLVAADLEQMADILDRSEAAHRANDVEASAFLNAEFHATLYRACDSPRLFALIENLRSSSASYIRLSSVFKPTRADIEREHRAILDACRARSPSRAAAAITYHLQHTLQVVSDGLATAVPGSTAENGPGTGPQSIAVGLADSSDL